jgi:cysteine synthase B
MGLFCFLSYTMHRTTLIKDDLFEKVRGLGKLVGNTPLIPLIKIFSKDAIRIYAKAEWRQLSGSVKARAAYNIILRAVEDGFLDENKVLLDATSGNTGIAYATIARELSIPVTLCLPENVSVERKHILRELGVDIIYTSKFGGTDEAQQTAKDLAKKYPGKYFYADQYKNSNNWKAHYYGTANEIFEQLPGITHFVAGLGTTGTFVGTGKRLKELNPSIRLIALQPDIAMHALEGWKHLETAMVPAIYDPGTADEIIEVSTEEAYHVIKEAGRLEHLRLSPSSAANLAGAIKVAKQISSGNIVTVLPDNADKYQEIVNKFL